jgi:hypothetical protein
MDSSVAASTSWNLVTSGSASVCIAATKRPKNKLLSKGKQQPGRRRREGNLRRVRTYDDEDLGDRAGSSGFGGVGRLVGRRRRHGRRLNTKRRCGGVGVGGGGGIGSEMVVGEVPSGGSLPAYSSVPHYGGMIGAASTLAHRQHYSAQLSTRSIVLVGLDKL